MLITAAASGCSGGVGGGGGGGGGGGSHDVDGGGGGVGDSRSGGGPAATASATTGQLPQLRSKTVVGAIVAAEVGEYAAAVLAGTMSLEVGLQLIARRAELIDQKCDIGWGG